MDAILPHHLTVSEAIFLSGIGRTKFYRLIGDGEVRAVKCGRRTLVERESLFEFIASLPAYQGASS
ncbi:excisionase family DNA-binding protein [Qipengyuania sp. CAU 1752]